MTPPPAATVAGGTVRRPRRSPGHVRVRRPAALPSLPRPALPSLPRPSLAAARGYALERLVGGRAWIVVIGVMLLGLVFLQVSLLQLNTQISTDIERAATLERANAATRSTISHLAAGRRVQDAARRYGMVLPGAGALCYLTADHAGPCHGGRQPGTTAQAADSPIVKATPPPGSPAAAAAAQQPAAQQPAAQQPAAQQPATQQPAPVAQQPATTAQPAAPAAQQPAAVQQQAVAQPAAAATTGGQAAPGQ